MISNSSKQQALTQLSRGRISGGRFEPADISLGIDDGLEHVGDHEGGKSTVARPFRDYPLVFPWFGVVHFRFFPCLPLQLWINSRARHEEAEVAFWRGHRGVRLGKVEAGNVVEKWGMSTEAIIQSFGEKGSLEAQIYVNRMSLKIFVYLSKDLLKKNTNIQFHKKYQYLLNQLIHIKAN